MPDTHEPFGQDVQEEAAKELDPIERHHPRLVSMSIIAPAEGDAFSIESQQTMVRDSNAVSVAAEIAQHLQRFSERGLRVHDPVLATQPAQKFSKLLAFAEYGGGSGAAELLAPMQTLQSVDELAAKDTS